MVLGLLLLSRRAHRPHTACSLLSVPGTALSAKASHSPSQAATCGCRARGPDARSRVLYALLREPAIFFTAAQFLLVPPLEILTQNVTQNIESRRGADRNDLRVFGDFRLKKARKALGRSGLSVWTQLITRRSLVQVQPPQPQNRLISCEIRRFFFTFCLQKFPEKLRDFAKFAVDPNRDPDRAKNVPWRSPSAPRLSCCLGLFFRFQIAAVRTFSIVLAASFCAAVVTWA